MVHQEADPVLRLPVPAAGSEEHIWHARRRPGISTREMRRQQGAYQSATPADLSQWTPSIPAPLAADLDEATQALVDFDTYTLRTLGPHSTAIGPMSAILLRTESSSSSEIEQLTSSAKQLALADLLEQSGPNARTIIGNVRAMEAALALADQLTQDTILAMHRVLLEHQAGMEEHAGRYREQVVWIGAGLAGPVIADFVPPQHTLIPQAMQDLTRFMDRADLPALLQVAVAHAQFETIHPFVDGNGRTGRALAHTMLRSKQVTRHITVPISAGLLTDTERYFHALTAYRHGDAGPIAERFTHAALYAAHTGKTLVDELAHHMNTAAEQLHGTRRSSHIWKILPELIAHPVINARFLQDNLGLSGPGAQRALDQLTEHGILRETTGRDRNRIWQHDGILSTLDNYAEQIRRHRHG